MTMTTILCDQGVLFDFDLHEKRLKEGCKALGFPYPELKIPLIKERSRLKIIITEKGPSYFVEACPPYSDQPVTLSVKQDAGIRLKTPLSTERKSWGDTLTVSPDGAVLQASCANLFWYYKDQFLTPDYQKLPIVLGTCLQRLEKSLSFQYVVWPLEKLIEERPLLFLCNAVREIVPVKAVGNTSFPTSPELLLQLLGQYRRMRYARAL